VNAEQKLRKADSKSS